MRTYLNVLPLAYAWQLGDLSKSFTPLTLTKSYDPIAYDHLINTRNEEEIEGQKDPKDLLIWPPPRVRTTSKTEIDNAKENCDKNEIGLSESVAGQQLPTVIFTLSQLQYMMGIFSIDPPKLLFTYNEEIHPINNLGIYRDISQNYKHMPLYEKIFEFVLKLMRFKRHFGHKSLKTLSTNTTFDGSNIEADPSKGASGNSIEIIQNILKNETELKTMAYKHNSVIDPAGMDGLLEIMRAAEDLVTRPTESEVQKWISALEPLPEDDFVKQADYHNLCDWYTPPMSCYHRMSRKCVYDTVKRWHGHPADVDYLPQMNIGHIALPRNPIRALQAIIDVSCNPWINQLHGDILLSSLDNRQFHKRWAKLKSINEVSSYINSEDDLKQDLNGVETKAISEEEKEELLKQDKEGENLEGFSTMVNDPEFKEQWHLHDLKVPDAWDYTRGDPNVVTMVIDTGCQPDHPDLKDNFWINPNPGSSGFGQNDIHGINTSEDNDDITDPGTHGTHMSGVVAATTNNGIGVAGVGYGAKLACCRFISGSSGKLSNVNKCIHYAIEKQLSVLSLSVGGDAGLPTTEQAIRKATEAGMFIAACSGDAGTDNDIHGVYPAQYATDPTLAVVSVGGYAENGTLIDYGNYGKNSVETAGPGDYVFATSVNSGYEYRGGTSPATPCVAGVAALVKSANRNLNGLEIKDIIRRTVQHVPEWSEKIKWSGKPDAGRAVAAALGK